MSRLPCALPFLLLAPLAFTSGCGVGEIGPSGGGTRIGGVLVPTKHEDLTGENGTERSRVWLPSGAVKSVSWTIDDQKVRLLVEGGHLRRHFKLESPPRLVFDVEGAAPSASHVVGSAGPFIKQVRVGKQGDGTRVVVDLERLPRTTTRDGSALLLAF